MPSLLEEILGEKEGALPPEPVKPAETGDFWTDMKNRYNYTAAQAEYAGRKAQASQRPFSEQMKVGEIPADTVIQLQNRFVKGKKWSPKSQEVRAAEKEIEQKTVQRGIDEGDFISDININKWEEIFGVPYEGKGQRIVYDGQDYKVSGEVGDSIQLQPVQSMENVKSLTDYLKNRGKR